MWVERCADVPVPSCVCRCPVAGANAVDVVASDIPCLHATPLQPLPLPTPQNFSCNGAVVKNKELGKVIQLQGDQRQVVFNFMKKCKICEEDRMVVHGF